MAPCGAGDSGAQLLLLVSPGGRLDCTGASTTGKTGLQAEAGPVAVAVGPPVSAAAGGQEENCGARVAHQHRLTLLSKE